MTIGLAWSAWWFWAPVLCLPRPYRAATYLRPADVGQPQRLRLRHHHSPRLDAGNRPAVLLGRSGGRSHHTGALDRLAVPLAWASVRSRRVERLVRSEPSLVDHNGFLHEAMRQERVTADELSQSHAHRDTPT